MIIDRDMNEILKLTEPLSPTSLETSKEICISFYEKFNKEFGKNWGWCTNDRMGWMMDIIYNFIEEGKDPTIVEIGTYCGRGTLPLGLVCKHQQKGKVYTIDPHSNVEATKGYEYNDYTFWSKTDFKEVRNFFKKVLIEGGIKEYVEYINKPSNDFDPPKIIDFLIIDGQHNEQCVDDIKKYAPHVPIGGVIYLDDLDWIEKYDPESLLFELGFKLYHYVDKGGCYRRLTEPDIGTNPSWTLNEDYTNTMWIVDNFYKNPDKVRQLALRQEYDEGGIGRGYIGNRTWDQHLFPELKSRFEKIMGKTITNWENHGMNGRFQYCWSGQPLVYHADAQQWGGMIYLSNDAPYECGTTLYASKENGARSTNDVDWDLHWKGDGDVHLDPTPWEPVDVAGNVYNRLVIFDASNIHAASQYFGTKKENCRMWQMFFFDTLEK